MFALYISVFLRAASDVVLYAYLPLHLNQVLGPGHFGLISLFLAVPACIRAVMAPLWGRAISDTSSSGSTNKVRRRNTYRPYIVLALGGYAVILFFLPRLKDPLVGLILVAFGTVLTSAFNPVTRTWLTLGDRLGLFRLATWHQWEGAGYFVSGAAFGLALFNDSFILINSAALLSGLIVVCTIFIWFTLPRGGQARAGHGGHGPRQSDPFSIRSVRGLPKSIFFFHFIAFLFWEAVAGTFSLRWVEDLDGSLPLFGLSISVATLVAAFSYKPLANLSRRLSLLNLFTIAAVGYSVMYVFMIVPSIWSVGIAYMVPMSSVLRTGTNRVIAEEVVETKRGLGMGLVDAIESGAAVLGFLMGGFGANAFGLSMIPVIALLGCIPLYVVLAGIKRRRSHR